jgi:thiol-disulfide isomerase/thioredoxin
MAHSRRPALGLALVASLFVAWAGCASSGTTGGEAAETPSPRGAPKSGNRKVGAPMPSIVVKELNGKRKIDLGALRGKVVLVDIWASWCAPCMEEMPLLDEMAGRLRDKGVEIIAVSVDEEKESAETFLGSRPKWTLTVAHDPKGKVPDVLKPSKMPTSYVLDAEGIIRYVNEGFERGDMKILEERLTKLAGNAS